VTDSLAAFAYTTLPYLLVLSTWAMFVPQAVQVFVTGAAGVSADAWAALLASRLAIVLYGLAVADPVQLWAASLPTLASAMVLAAALRQASGVGRRRVAVWAIVAAGVALAAAVTATATVASMALVASAAMSSVPQLVAAVRATDLSGVSVTAWAASAVSSVLWIVHGVVDDFPAVVVSSIVWLVVSVAIAAVTTCRRSLTGPACAGSM
jgi:uncharacterized protein with PQ loop repeat